jgi:integrase
MWVGGGNIYWLLAEAGLRAGELAGLRLEDVELDRITVNRSIWGGEEQDPKTQSAVRIIALSSQLADLLWTEVAKQKTSGRSHLFTVPSGSALDMDVYRQRKLKPTLEALELPQAGFPRIQTLQCLDAGLTTGSTEDHSGTHRSCTDGELHP